MAHVSSYLGLHDMFMLACEFWPLSDYGLEKMPASMKIKNSGLLSDFVRGNSVALCEAMWVVNEGWGVVGFP